MKIVLHNYITIKHLYYLFVVFYFLENTTIGYSQVLTDISINGTTGFSADLSPTLLPEPEWATVTKTYAAEHSMLSSQSTTPIENVKDIAENIQATNNTILNVAQLKPVLQSVTMNPPIINRGTPTAQLTLVFDNASAMMPDKPVISFDPDPGPLLTAGSGNWNGLTYTQNYSVNTSDNATILNGISVKVSGARDSDGTFIDETTKTNVFSIDMAGYTCKSVVFQPTKLEKGASTLKVTIEYEVPMRPSPAPAIVFVDASNNPIPDVNNNLFSSSSANWTSTTTYVITYQLKTDPQVQASNVHATVSGALTSGGSVQAPYTSTTTFTVDTKDIDAKITPTPSNVTCSSTQLHLKIEFNQQMKPTDEDFNITGLVDYDHKFDFLKFEKTEWLNNTTAVVTYKVYPNKPSDNTSVKVLVRYVENINGREMNKTYPDVFTAVSNPPVISNVIYTPPLCHDEESGSINLTVTGGTPGFTYQWIRNDGITGNSASPEITGLGPGQYGITVTGSDHCLATTEGLLTNPEGMIITANVVQNVVRKDDGIIEIDVEGGTPRYRYYVDGVSYPDSLIEHLAVGTYAIKVMDTKDCSMSTVATITDQRIPTAFTPNGDGFNDIFMEGKPVKIFDRNGTLLFEGNDGWDGKYKGNTMRPAVYFYIVTFPDGTERKGTVQIFKK